MSDAESKPLPEGPVSAAAANPVVPWRRWLAPLLVVLIVCACVAAIAVVRGWDLFGDHAIANVVTLILSFVALMTLSGWALFRSTASFRAGGWRFSLRWLLGFTTIVAAVCGILVGVLRINELSGDLVPTFALRWTARHDELLAKPQDGGLVDGQPPADMSTTTDGDFPQFLGPARRLAVEGVELARDWSQWDKRPLWRQPIGAGWSAFACVNGFAVTMEQRDDLELVTCYEMKTGKLRWTHALTARYQTVMGGVGPRSTPTIDGGRVYALGATGVFRCLDGADGRLLWKKDLVALYKISRSQEDGTLPYGRANSPLIVGNVVVVPAGGPPGDGRRVSLVAFDKQTGRTVWEGGTRQISYSSPVLATLAGTEQLLIVNEDTVTGHDPTTGRELWSHPWSGTSATNASSSQAVPLSPDRVFLSKGYGNGSSVLRIAKTHDGVWSSTEVWHEPTRMKTKFANVAAAGDSVFGLSDGILECLRLEDGRRRWKRGRYGHGQILRVGDLLLVAAESGELVLVEANPDKHNELGRFQAIEGRTWNNLCLSGPYLLIRNAEEAACYKLPLAPE